MLQEGFKFDMQIMTWLNENNFFSAAFEQYQLESDMQLYVVVLQEIQDSLLVFSHFEILI